MPIENLFKYVLKEQADSPQVVESFIDYTGDVIRRGDRSMLKTSPETAALGQDEIIKDVIEQPISLAKGQQKIAQDVLEETVDVSKTAQTEVTKGRTSLRKQDEILLNKLAQANPKELKQGIKEQFGKEIVKEMGVDQGQTTIRQVSDVIAKYGYNGQGTADSTLQVIFGKDGAKELYDHRNDPDEFHNLAGNPEYKVIQDRLLKWLPTNTTPEFKTKSERSRKRSK